ncbi:unnamed protein product [Sphenostylis stenocarpa]|uniref:Uncharacterized protein n=1 Tax=Sphenostylis stenocarpa TaxID=92480 RepID=A0AA86TQE6_9FABA|nr:unnamed protein product [Sphenostylis stenocarpa]
MMCLGVLHSKFKDKYTIPGKSCSRKQQDRESGCLAVHLVEEANTRIEFSVQRQSS